MMNYFLEIFLLVLTVWSVNVSVLYITIIQDLTKPGRSLETANTGVIIALWSNLVLGVTVAGTTVVCLLTGNVVGVYLVFTSLSMVFPLYKLWRSRRLQTMEMRPWIWAWLILHNTATAGTLAMALVATMA